MFLASFSGIIEEYACYAAIFACSSVDERGATPLSIERVKSGFRDVMPHEIAQLLLEHAETFLERKEAMETAIQLGTPLLDSEEHLDWLGMVRGRESETSFCR